jgi:hypothetical protein
MPFFKNGEQEGKIGPVLGQEEVCGTSVWEGGYKERLKKGKCGRNITYSCMKMEK